MNRKRRRLVWVLAGLACLGVATTLVLYAFNDNLVFFQTPTDLVTDAKLQGRHVRIGGLVEEKSVIKEDGGKTLAFRITDGNHALPVTYTGVIPDLFREGQGVVAEGVMGSDGTFKASSVLAKHDERYMPPEVAEALKKSGHWQEGGPPPGTAAAKQ